MKLTAKQKATAKLAVLGNLKDIEGWVWLGTATEPLRSEILRLVHAAAAAVQKDRGGK